MAVHDKMLYFAVSDTNAFAAPLSRLTSIDVVDTDTINFSFMGGGLANGDTKSALVTCDITAGTHPACIKTISEHLYASGSMTQNYLEVAVAAAGIGTITACTAIAIDQ
mgnify:FL=1